MERVMIFVKRKNNKSNKKNQYIMQRKDTQTKQNKIEIMMIRKKKKNIEKM